MVHANILLRKLTGRWFVVSLALIMAGGASLLRAQTAGNDIRFDLDKDKKKGAAPAPAPILMKARDVVSRITAGEKATLLDTRSDEAWNSSDEKAKGAVRVPHDRVPSDLPWPRDRFLVSYCTCPSEHSSASVAEELREKGYINAFAMVGGLDAWKEAGGAMESK